MAEEMRRRLNAKRPHPLSELPNFPLGTVTAAVAKKKFCRLRAFIVTIILVVQALGKTKRASSMARFSAARSAAFSSMPEASSSCLCLFLSRRVSSS